MDTGCRIDTARRIKRIIFAVWGIFFLMGILSQSVYAAGDDTIYSAGHFYYHSYPGYVSICGYLGDETDITIPSNISGKPVSVIEGGAFDGCDTVKTIEIPDTVIKVADDSFTGADALEKIVCHAVDVQIKVNDGVGVDYNSLNEDLKVADTEHGSNNTEAGSDDSDNSKTGIDKQRVNSAHRESDSNKQDIDNASDKNRNSTDKHNSDSSKSDDIGNGNFLEIDGSSDVKNADQTKKDSIIVNDSYIQSENSKDDMIATSNTEQYVDSGKEGKEQMGLSDENENSTFYGIVAFGVMAVIVYGIGFLLLKKKRAV